MSECGDDLSGIAQVPDVTWSLVRVPRRPGLPFSWFVDRHGKPRVVEFEGDPYEVVDRFKEAVRDPIADETLVVLNSQGTVVYAERCGGSQR